MADVDGPPSGRGDVPVASVRGRSAQASAEAKNPEGGWVDNALEALQDADLEGLRMECREVVDGMLERPRGKRVKTPSELNYVREAQAYASRRRTENR